MKKGLVFDLDGVITDTAKFHYIAWKNMAEKIGINLNKEIDEQLKGLARMDALEKILSFGNVKDKYTQEEKEKMAEEKNNEYLNLLESLGPNDILPGVVELLNESKRLDLKSSIASASKNAPYILKKLEIFDYFSFIVDPDSLTNSKPDPEIFIRAAEGIGLTPSEVIGFEDAQSGVDGLKAANIYTVGVIHGGDIKNADYKVHSLLEINLERLIQN